jgi:hypothetical protein
MLFSSGALTVAAAWAVNCSDRSTSDQICADAGDALSAKHAKALSEAPYRNLRAIKNLCIPQLIYISPSGSDMITQ